MNNIIRYTNGNRLIIVDGNNGDKTRLRPIGNTEWYKPQRPENVDINTSYLCLQGCDFCYLGATPRGTKWEYDEEKLNQIFVGDMKGLEVAININDDPDTFDMYKKLADYFNSKQIFPNFTINSDTYIRRKAEIMEIDFSWLGISCHTMEEINIINDMVSPQDNVVIHVVNKVIEPRKLISFEFTNVSRLLILGYKMVGRGISFARHPLLPSITRNDIDKMQGMTIAFDNLAMEQIDLSDHPLYNIAYLGDDGTASFYIDLVKDTYSISSTLKDQTLNISNDEDIISMFSNIQGMT